jgi:hypothetical protein
MALANTICMSSRLASASKRFDGSIRQYYPT